MKEIFTKAFYKIKEYKNELLGQEENSIVLQLQR